MVNNREVNNFSRKFYFIDELNYHFIGHKTQLDIEIKTLLNALLMAVSRTLILRYPEI